eukprot:scaffold76903_cov33-Tisochrysis_lutea.AAC.1
MSSYRYRSCYPPQTTAPAAHGPKQLWMMTGIHLSQRAIWEYNLRSNQVVSTQTKRGGERPVATREHPTS